MSSPRRILVGRSAARRPHEVPPPSPRSKAGGEVASSEGSGARPRRSSAEIRAEQIAAARGYSDGLAQGRAAVEAAVAAAGNLAAELERLAPREAGRAAAAISRLALVVAERILGRAVVLDPALLVEVVEQAAATINGSPTARVILNPTARPIVEAAWIARHGTAYLGKRWRFEADSSLAPGGCRLVYEHGFVDASLETQIEEIGRAIEHALPTLLREVAHLASPDPTPEGSAAPEGGPALDPSGGVR